MSTRVDFNEYRRVRNESNRREKGQGPENEIRVTATRGQRSYISYAIALLTGAEGKEKHNSVKVSAMGGAIYHAVNISEIVKRRVKGLHQTTDISSETVRDQYEAIDSKKSMEIDRKVSTILITLSTQPLNTKHIGYQAPLTDDQVTEQENQSSMEYRGRSRGRGYDRREGADRRDDRRDDRLEDGRGGRGGRERGGNSRGGRGNGERGGRGNENRGGRGGGDRDGYERRGRDYDRNDRGDDERGSRGWVDRGSHERRGRGYDRGGRGGNDRGGRGGGDRGGYERRARGGYDRGGYEGRGGEGRRGGGRG